MAVLAADIEARTAELSESSFTAFCDDIAGMFDADVTCARQDVGTGTVKDVQQHFKKLAVVHHVQATGALDGTFHLFFDQGGLFTLSGVVVMLPERRILDGIKRGSIDEAENLTDAAREVGNLLVGSWDRVFREECEGHDHFVKTETFIGKPWEKLDEVGLSADEELTFVLFEMTVDSYPSFRCAAVFPKTTFGGPSSPEAADASTAPAPEEPSAAEPEPVAPPAPATASAAPPEPVVSTEPAGPAEPAAATPDSEVQPSAPEQTEAEPETAPAPEPPKESPAAVEAPSEPVDEPVAASAAADPVEAAAIPEDIRSTVETVVGAVSADVPPAAPTPKPAPPARAPGAGSLDHMFNDLVEYSCDSGIAELLKVQAQEIMVPEVVWSAPDDTVQNVVSKMQQHNTGYVLIGQNGVLEGLVSNSNILGAVSPYLRPMFAKWRRPEDDATLEIKIKWVMSRPVRTVRPDATLASMIESMRRCGGRCLPVVDSQSKVLGIVTVFDILFRVLAADKSFSWEGRPPQAPPLLI